MEDELFSRGNRGLGEFSTTFKRFDVLFRVQDNLHFSATFGKSLTRTRETICRVRYLCGKTARFGLRFIPKSFRRRLYDKLIHDCL